MTITSLTGSNAQTIKDLNSVYANPSAAANKTSATTEVESSSNGSGGAGSNNSELNAVVRQVLSQINSTKDISAFFGTDQGQEAGADFTSNLLSNLPGLSSSNRDGSPVAGLALDQSSGSYHLQNSIQKLITQLDSNKSEDSGLGNLQEAFNALIKKSGGDPSAENLQSFLKLVAVNIQGSTSIGSLFSTSA